MRALFLSLMFVAGVTMTGVANQSVALEAAPCVNCWDFANGAEHGGGSWSDAYDHCLTNLDPCSIQLETVVIKR